MYEYVITAGEGIMIELGICQSVEWLASDFDFQLFDLEGRELLVRPCDDDCETGQ